MQNDKRTEMFESAPIPRAVATMAIPNIVTTLVMVIYNMADTFFIGQTGDALQVAAISICMPVFTVFMAMGGLFGMGGNSSISRALGAGKEERAKHISAFCFYGCMGVSIILAIIILIFMTPVLHLVGASDADFGYARSYLTILTIGSPFIVSSQNCANLLRGSGSPTASMVGNLTGTITNIILDPIFILVFGWGVPGAAAATVLGNMVAFVYYIIYFNVSHVPLSLNIKNFTVHDHIPIDVLSIGLPASLNQLLMSFAQVIMNNTITQYGDIPLAAMNVAMRTNMIVVFTQMGLCMGIQPLCGYNYASGNKKRLVSIFRFTAITTVILGTILTIIMVIARRSVVTAFIDNEEVIGYGIRMVVALQTSGPFVGLCFLSTSCLQGMGKAGRSLILTLSRQVLAYIPCIIILNALFGLNRLIYAQPIADYVAVIVGFTICVVTLVRMKPSGRYAPAQQE